MTLYEIDDAITDLVDPETGEILDFDAFDNLQMERENKIENVGLWVKDLVAEADALKKEADTLTERRRANERKVEKLKAWLAYALDGKRFTTPKCDIRTTTSHRLECSNEELFREWAEKTDHKDMLIYRDPSISKTTITEAIKDGQQIPFCSISDHKNINIK